MINISYSSPVSLSKQPLLVYFLLACLDWSCPTYRPPNMLLFPTNWEFFKVKDILYYILFVKSRAALFCFAFL